MFTVKHLREQNIDEDTNEKLDKLINNLEDKQLQFKDIYND